LSTQDQLLGLFFFVFFSLSHICPLWGENIEFSASSVVPPDSTSPLGQNTHIALVSPVAVNNASNVHAEEEYGFAPADVHQEVSTSPSDNVLEIKSAISTQPTSTQSIDAPDTHSTSPVTGNSPESGANLADSTFKEISTSSIGPSDLSTIPATSIATEFANFSSTATPPLASLSAHGDSEVTSSNVLTVNMSDKRASVLEESDSVS
jgi:hypothetical protein